MQTGSMQVFLDDIVVVDGDVAKLGLVANTSSLDIDWSTVGIVLADGVLIASESINLEILLTDSLSL